MYLIRNIMYCKPAHAKPMVERFKIIAAAQAKAGFKTNPRIMTDVAAERYWTVVMEIAEGAWLFALRALLPLRPSKSDAG